MSLKRDTETLAIRLFRVYLVKNKLFQRNAKCQCISYAVVFNRKTRIMTAVMAPLVVIVV